IPTQVLRLSGLTCSASLRKPQRDGSALRGSDVGMNRARRPSEARMKSWGGAALIGMSSSFLGSMFGGAALAEPPFDPRAFTIGAAKNAVNLAAEGERIFRFDTFGDEAF